MRRTLAIVVLLLTSPAMLAKDAPSLVGVYRCEGINAVGKPYRALVEITAMGKLFAVHWVFPEGVEMVGVGFLYGGVFAVNFHDDTTVGLAIYKIDGTKPMKGQWAGSGSEEIFSETLTRAPNYEMPTVKPKPKPPRTVDREGELQG